jgi:CRISPR-associated protein Cmr2
MSNYLFLFTIGPVQSFIAQARKTQDLYAGSQLLSRLCKTAAKKAENDYHAEIIFPNIDQNPDSVPNRFIAEIKTEDIGKIGKEIEDSVKGEFLDIANQNRKGNPTNFDVQIENFLEVYWVALPYEKDKYADKYEKIERLLGAVKNVRAFSQLPEEGRKCSLCGERNALFYNTTSYQPPAFIQRKYQVTDQLIRYLKDVDESTLSKLKELENDVFYGYHEFMAFLETKLETDEVNRLAIPIAKFKSFEIDAVNLNTWHLADKEGLCAVCFTKRFYATQGDSFPSTAKVALMNSIPEKEFKAFKYDAQLFYDENFTDTYFEKHGISESVEEVEKQRDKILGKYKLKASSLPKYYAIIAFDGDSMGKWLSGDKIKENADLKEFHKNLSESLGKFAEEAQKILIEPKGRTVYAGGEDFIGFINLNHLFNVMKKLREQFKEMVNEEVKSYFKNEDDEMTFSAGIAIAHYKTPLSEVLKWARNMEKEAKEIDDKKNAFAIAVLKRSGEINKTVYKWKYGDNWTTCLMADIIGKLKKEKDGFSNTFIKNLNLEFVRMKDEEGKLEDGKDILIAELRRLLRRSCNEKKKGRTQKKYDEEVGITDLVEKLGKVFSAEELKKHSFDNFLSLLNIADFIAREINKE